MTALINIANYDTPEDLREAHARGFAAWLRDSQTFNLDTLAKAAAAVNEKLRIEWRACAAEAWLASLQAPAEKVPEFLNHAQPFLRGPTIDLIASLRCAPGVIPLDMPPSGGLARVWIIHDHEKKLASFQNPQLEGLDALFPAEGEWRLFIAGCDPHKVDGSSWQLGAMLARWALEREHPLARRKLAADWLVTGSVRWEENGRYSVQYVGLGSKAKLPEYCHDADRLWLMPAANERPAEADYAELASRAAGRLHFSKDVRDAWAYITGEAMHVASDEHWPNDFAEVHGFVSNSQGPFLAMILQTVALRREQIRVVLWATRSMEGLAKELKQALVQCCERINLPKPLVEIPKAFDATDKEEPHVLNRTQRDLADDASLGTVSGPKILFNYNGGTVLHRTAVQQRAALNPRIWLAYRDGDHRRTLDFTFIRLHTGSMLEGRLRLRPEACKTVNWQALVDHWRLVPQSRSLGPKPTSEEQISALVAAAIPGTLRSGAFIPA